MTDYQLQADSVDGGHSSCVKQNGSWRQQNVEEDAAMRTVELEGGTSLRNRTTTTKDARVLGYFISHKVIAGSVKEALTTSSRLRESVSQKEGRARCHLCLVKQINFL